MRQNDCCLILDFDGVLVDSLPLIDQYVKEIDYEASDEYCRLLFEQADELNKEKQRLEEERSFYGEKMLEINSKLDELQKLVIKHFDHKDMVLEEVYPKLRGLIDYSKIYQMENTYSGVVEFINKIWNLSIYDRIIICSHVNVDSEILSKKKFISNYLPMAKFIPVKFHIDPYFDPMTGLKNRNRIPTDKLAVLVKLLPYINISASSVIDDTRGIIEKGKALGFRCYHRKIEDDVCDILITSTNETIDINQNCKVKKLSK